MHAESDASSPATQTEGLPPAVLLGLFFLTLCLLFSRRPGDLLHAQFYAEDGKRWYAQAYNLHWSPSLLVPDASYLHLLARLLTGPALLLSLAHAPLWMNLCGATVQALPAVFLLSSRGAPWGSLRVRVALAALYLAAPNFGEIHVVLTNAQWHYSLLQVLVAFSRPPESRLQKASDIVLFVLGSFSGPFDLVLLPVLLLYWWQARERWTLVLVACLALGSLFQVDTLLTGSPFGLAHAQSAAARADNVPLGASLSNLVRIVGGTLFLDGMVGYIDPGHLPRVTPVIFLCLGLLIVGFGLRWGPAALRYFALYAVLIFVASLRSPIIFDPVSRWHGLAAGTGGMRYCFLPTMVFLWSAVYAFTRSSNNAVRGICALVFLIFLTGLRRWEYPRFEDHHFATYVQQVDHAQPGQVLNIPLEPTPWFMTLIKH